MGMVVTAKKALKTRAPVTMINIMPVLRMVSMMESLNPCQVSCRLTRDSTIAPHAPTAPASVGVNQPIMSPPRIKQEEGQYLGSIRRGPISLLSMRSVAREEPKAG